MAVFRRLRQRRYNVLINEHFLNAEAQVMSEFKFKQPYIRLMRLARRDIVRGISREGLTRREALVALRRRIDQEYELKGWRDAYAMMRYYRQLSIDADEYIPPPPSKRKPTDKGDVKKQKLRAKARRERGAISSQYDSQGKLIGDVVFNESSGRFEVRGA